MPFLDVELSRAGNKQAFFKNVISVSVFSIQALSRGHAWLGRFNIGVN